ncbi:MAG: phosphoenolpyruvate--protein phosphotransferase [Planctomycetes bacterium]|nr:phosphoenolpyruvate--protein phosphotransferase [Planctomycetota bacterium]
MAKQRGSGKGPERKSIFKGIAVVPGIAIGRVTLKFRQTQILSDRTIKPDEVAREHERLAEAVRLSKAQLLEARSKVAKEIGELEAMIFDAHILILEDQAFLRKVRDQVANDFKPAEVVVSTIVEGYYQTLKKVPDEHLRERAADLRDVGRRLLENLAHLQDSERRTRKREDTEELPSGTVIFARELLPSDIATLERRHCEGVACELGSERGHAAVMLRAMNVPSVMGLEDIGDNIKDGDLVIVDGSTGTVYVNPKKDVLDSYTATKKEFDRFQTSLAKEVDLPSLTTDGHHISLLANVSKQSEIDLAKMYKVEGIGLYRSEFHLMAGSAFPDEEEQYQIYREAVTKMDGKPVTIRTMDLGSDKKLPYLKLPDEDTHVLGRRSIRLITDLEEFQIIQLKAILRASAHGKVKLMFPFITSLEDIRLAKRMLRTARRELEISRKKFDQNIPVGMMVEVPAAALSMDKFVREVQFFSVGTNDLTQYVCAADRNHPDVAAWYKAHNPGMLSILRIIVDTAKAHNSDLTVCGEMAGDPFYTMFLLGLGVTKFSMPAPQVPLVKKIIRSVNLTGARNLANRALQYTSTIQIRELFAHTVEQILGRDLGGWRKEETE